jgi:dihydropyrimidinase
VLAEVLAVEKAIALCELADSPIYIVHLSSARALEICANARARGLPVHVETRPIYLHLTAQRYETADAPLYVGMPPLRSATDGEALWRALADGRIDTVGSDHAPWMRAQKLDPSHGIEDPVAGMSNLQVMLPMLYSEGVLKGRLSLERFVAITSTNAARLFGLLPHKGVLEAGSDADIAVWDPAQETTIRAGKGYTREDFSIYEGWKVTGSPRLTLRRGEIVCENGRVDAAPGTGRLLVRQRHTTHEHP